MAERIESGFLDELFAQIRDLPVNDQEFLMLVVKKLKQPRGESIQAILKQAREINFSKQALAEMEEAIKETEFIDLDEWDLPS
jgi:hypothetical protein